MRQLELFFHFRSVCINLGSQAKPYQTKPRHFRPIFRPFWPNFEPKVPKSKWIWFGDTYPLNQWSILSWKYWSPPLANLKNIISVQRTWCLTYPQMSGVFYSFLSLCVPMSSETLWMPQKMQEKNADHPWHLRITWDNPKLRVLWPAKTNGHPV